MTKKIVDGAGDLLNNLSGGAAATEAGKNRESGEKMYEAQLAATKEMLEYSRERDEENRALAKESDDRAYEFSQSQFAHAQDLDERNLQRSDEQDQYRRGLVSDMMADADVSDQELSSRVNNASSDVTRSFLKARGITNRNLARYGINPADGRYGASAKENEADLVTADVASRNATRSGVREEEKTAKQRARNAGLGLVDTSLGLSNQQLNQGISNPNGNQLSLGDMTYGAMGGEIQLYRDRANQYMDNAQAAANASSQAASNAIQTGAIIYGAS